METPTLSRIEDAALKMDGRVPLKLTPDGAAWRVMSGAVDVFAQHPPAAGDISCSVLVSARCCSARLNSMSG